MNTDLPGWSPVPFQPMHYPRPPSYLGWGQVVIKTRGETPVNMLYKNQVLGDSCLFCSCGLNWSWNKILFVWGQDKPSKTAVDSKMRPRPLEEWSWDWPQDRDRSVLEQYVSVSSLLKVYVIYMQNEMIRLCESNKVLNYNVETMRPCERNYCLNLQPLSSL